MCLAAVLGVGALVGAAAAQDAGLMPGLDPQGLGSTAPPMTQYGEGSFFSQELGTILRVRYNTESYGQNEHGNLDIGTMQVVNFEDAIAFFDGQVTLNDVQGVGFNIGVGHRWMHYVPSTVASERITGWSVWADGTSTREGNFFPQVGVSIESLGESWDVRANGYIPLGPQNKRGDFIPTGEQGYVGHFLSDLTEAVVNSSFNVGELEVARRLGAERDAWAFAGPYFLANDQDDAIGYRIGLRGYAYPDLLLQFSVSDDDIFATNATFSLIWFVGRTRTNFQPTCGLPDRFREPVLRNDYVALAQSTAIGGITLTYPDDTPVRLTFVDPDAPDGGDGSFEHPLNNLADVNAFSEEGDIILPFGGSLFDGDDTLVLKDRQAVVGEGDDFEYSVTTQEEGVVILPETSPGARNLDKPTILNSINPAIQLADQSEVTNLLIDGGPSAIVAGPNGAGDPFLHDLMIQNTIGSAIVLTPFVRVDTEDQDNDTNTTEKFIAFIVTIDNVMFDNIGVDDIDIDAFTAENVNAPDVTLLESIRISDVTSTNGNGRGIRLRRTHETGAASIITNYMNTDASAADGRIRFEEISGDVTITTADISGGTGFAIDFEGVDAASAVTIDGLTYDGLAGAAGGIRADTYDGTLTVRNSTLTGGTLSGVALRNESDGTFMFQDTVTFEDIAGTVIEVDGGASDLFTGVVSVGGTIMNTMGRSVIVRGMSDATSSVSFLGDITDDSGSGLGILVDSNDSGMILFAGEVVLNTGGNAAVTLTDNTNTDIDFADLVDIETTSGAGFVATDGGTLTVSGTTNSIMTDTGRIVEISDMAVSGLGVNFSGIDRMSAAATEAVLLSGNTGGPVVLGTLGDDAGDSGTLQGGDADTVVVRNSANVTMSGLVVNNAAGFSGVLVDKTSDDAMTLNFNDLAINDGDIGVEVLGGATTGNLIMTLNDTDILDSTATGFSVSDVNAGTLQVNNATFNPADNADGVVLTDNQGANLRFAGLNIDTTNAGGTSTGRGFVATGGGTLRMTGTDNVIETDNGTGLELDGMAIESNGVQLQQVTVDGTTGPGNAIVMRDLTGGQVAIGTTTGAADSGGELRSTGDAIVLENVRNVDLRQMRIISAGGEGVNIDHTVGAAGTMDVTIDGLNLDAATGDGINVAAANNGNTFNLRLTDSDLESNVVMSNSGSSSFGLLLENNAITSSGTDVAFALSFSGSAQTSNVTVRNLNNFTAANASAIDVTANGSNADINFLLDNNIFTNSSNVAASETGGFLVDGGATMDANIVNNSFTNSGTADEFAMTSDGMTTRINLDLVNNNATAGGFYELTTQNQGTPGTDFNFGVRNRGNMDSNNNLNSNIGTVNFNSMVTDFEDLTNPIPLPIVP